MSFRNAITALLLAILIALLIAQFPKVERTNPPAIGEVSVPPAIEATLRRA